MKNILKVFLLFITKIMIMIGIIISELFILMEAYLIWDLTSIFKIGISLTILVAIIIFLVFLYRVANLWSKKEVSKIKKLLIRPIILLIGISIPFALHFKPQEKIPYFQRISKQKCYEQEAKLEFEYKQKTVLDFFSKADEKISYNKNKSITNDNIFSFKFENTILIDYDSHSVGFLFSYEHFNRHFYDFYNFELNESLPINSDNIQFDHMLSYPGIKFTTFYPDQFSTDSTSAIQLIMKDGTSYNISFEGYFFQPYYLGFPFSKQSP